MSIEMIDGWDHYTSNYNRKWDTLPGVSTGTGRYGTGLYAAPDSGGFRKLLSGNLTTIVTGFAFARNGLGNFALVCLHDGGTLGATGTNQVDVRVTSTGAVTVTRNGTVLATSANFINSQIWYYLEFKVTIGSSAAYEVRINGTTIISGTGNTQNTANAFANQISLNLVSGDSGRNTWFDDFYVLNTSGTANNDFLGECRIFTSYPTGAGATTQWTPSAGSNFGNVDETNPNDDTDYNSSSTVGQIDLYTTGALSFTGSIACVQHTICARKDDVGTRQIAEQCRSGTTTFTGATQTMTATYFMYREVRETDPNTLAAWTLANLNSSQFGVKVIA